MDRIVDSQSSIYFVQFVATARILVHFSPSGSIDGESQVSVFSTSFYFGPVWRLYWSTIFSIDCRIVWFFLSLFSVTQVSFYMGVVSWYFIKKHHRHLLWLLDDPILHSKIVCNFGRWYRIPWINNLNICMQIATIRFFVCSEARVKGFKRYFMTLWNFLDIVIFVSRLLLYLLSSKVNNIS